MNTRILLVEDEPGLVLTLADLLAAEGFEVETAGDGRTGLEAAVSGRHDLILLDVMLPGMTGFEVCKEMRHRGVETPVLMLTARTQVIDRVVGLKLGADDYLTKPFDPSELIARVEALLRRVHKDPRGPVARFRFSDVQVDFDRSVVVRNETVVPLTGKELQLLRYFIEHRGKVLSRDELLKEVWQYQPTITSRTVDVHVAWLRQKLEENPQFPKHFHTIRGTGYRFAP